MAWVVTEAAVVVGPGLGVDDLRGRAPDTSFICSLSLDSVRPGEGVFPTGRHSSLGTHSTGQWWGGRTTF